MKASELRDLLDRHIYMHGDCRITVGVDPECTHDLTGVEEAWLVYETPEESLQEDGSFTEALLHHSPKERELYIEETEATLKRALFITVDH